MTPLTIALAVVLSVPSGDIPAARISQAVLTAGQEVQAPEGSRCPELYPVAVANWPGAEDEWRTLDAIFWRESRCNPVVVNRYGCVGLMQVCRGNHERLGVTRADLQDPAVNIATGYRLCQESIAGHHSCFRPWWVGKFRP